ncbi:hypothetical protein PHMEG_0002503 [Phytophthora megakarya]|uniref:BZIP domain-containing protein n=1 Tax=Phytophthora megakarya TaxID=4795 RepID=A0A225X0A7_9STRA|nr:hypothetical protein PHMEG_0002503 [Phytophthora megakarya]
MHHFSTPELSTYPPKANVSTRSNVRLSTIEANKRDAAALRRRRERNRLHQARYKRNQDAHMAAMEDNIRQLHGEIRKLQLQRQLLLLSPSKMNSWSVVAEYFRLFRFGVNPTASETRLHASVENVYPIDRQVQRNFLLATMMPDVTDGIVVGVDAIMMNWEYVTQRLPGLQIEVTCLENGPKGSIVATTQHTLTFSKMMLHHIFPHLSRAEKKSSDIADKLLGHQILIRSTVHFEWDSENCRVSSFETKADMVTPVLRLVGNLDDVSHIFSKACLTPEFGFVRGADTGFVGTDPAM